MVYGITLHARRYVERVMSERFAPGIVLFRFKERGWNAHPGCLVLRPGRVGGRKASHSEPFPCREASEARGWMLYPLLGGEEEMIQ